MTETEKSFTKTKKSSFHQQFIDHFLSVPVAPQLVLVVFREIKCLRSCDLLEKTHGKNWKKYIVPTLPFDTLFFLGGITTGPPKNEGCESPRGWKMIRPSFFGGQHRPIFQRPWKLLVSGFCQSPLVSDSDHWQFPGFLWPKWVLSKTTNAKTISKSVPNHVQPHRTCEKCCCFRVCRVVSSGHSESLAL